ncbi:MAG: methyltransferase family protein [Planctomycetota bacterium]
MNPPDGYGPAPRVSTLRRGARLQTPKAPQNSGAGRRRRPYPTTCPPSCPQERRRNADAPETGCQAAGWCHRVRYRTTFPGPTSDSSFRRRPVGSGGNRATSTGAIPPAVLRQDYLAPYRRPLVTHGIYARMRHPSETGTLLIAAGAAALLASPTALVIVVLWITPCVLRRIRLEDRLLARHFPTAFAVWAKRVPALLPRYGG